MKQIMITTTELTEADLALWEDGSQVGSLRVNWEEDVLKLEVMRQDEAAVGSVVTIAY